MPALPTARRALVATVAVAAVAVAVGHLTGGADRVVVDVPAEGQAAGALVEGAPALVIHERGGQVHAVDARAPVREGGWRRALVGWCVGGDEPGRLFAPGFRGAWRADGRPVAEAGAGGSDGGAAAVPPLATFEVELDGSATIARIGPRRDPVEGVAPSTRSGAAGCTRAELIEPPVMGEPADVAALADAGDDVLAVDATLEQLGQTTPRICATPRLPQSAPTATFLRAVDAGLPHCGREGRQGLAMPVERLLPMPADDLYAYAEFGRMSVVVADDEIDEVWFAPSVRRAGGPIGGEAVLEGELLGGAGGDVVYEVLYDTAPDADGRRLTVDVLARDVEIVASPGTRQGTRTEGPVGLAIADDAEIALPGVDDSRAFVASAHRGDLDGELVELTVDRPSGEVVAVSEGRR